MTETTGAELLIVDDNKNNLKLLDEVLVEAGYRVRLARDGELALRSALAQPPALILLDIRMPGIDGLEVCRRLKADERTREVPVIFISILEDERDKVKGFQVGAVDYITKPFQPEEVLARIATHLRLRELSRRLEEMVAARTVALQESEAKYRTIVETAGEGIWLLGPNLATTFINDRMAKMLGCSVDEVLGRPVTDFLFEEDVDDFTQHKENRRREKRAQIYERRYRTKDGSVLWVQVSATSIFDEKARLLGSSCLVTDISERRQAEQLAQARLCLVEKAHQEDISLDELLRRMLDEIEGRTASSIGFYHFLEEDQETIHLQNWSTNTLRNMCTAEGKSSHYPVARAGVWADCVRERRPLIHNDYASLPYRKGMPDGHAQVVRELVVPIFRGERIVAIIGVGNKEAEYNETDVQTVSLLGDFSWEIVKSKRAEEELKQLNEELEKRVLARTAELEEKNEELERANRLFVGRELKMVELKQRIKELEERGKPINAQTLRRLNTQTLER